MVTMTEKEFAQLAGFIKANYGIHLRQEKTTLLIGRLHHVLQQAGFDNFTDYYHYLIADKSGEAVVTLVDKITTNHTFFMREPDHFYYFKDVVLPYYADTVRNKDLRIWCAASSTGEESYTLAILLDEFFGKDKLFWDTKVLGTDLCEKVLTLAKKGVYSKERIAPLPAHWKSTYFKQFDAENYVLIDRIRNEVIYRKFNLMEPVFPFRKKFHVIFCRNVMIYFDNETKARLIEKFCSHLEYGGYLFIGHSESINRNDKRFQYIMPSVYRKV